MKRALQITIRLQAAYYIASGAWPLLGRRAFEAVTGPKTDWWLVQMVAILAVSNGAALAVGARKKKVRPETIALSLATCTAFCIIDVSYVAKRRLRPVYLGDAAAELAIAATIAALKFMR